MNKILITRIADGKTFSEQSLAELLREDGESIAPDYIEEHPPELRYDKGENTFGWAIEFVTDYFPRPDWTRLDLDPAKYKISFANTLGIERVGEIMHGVRDVLDSYEQRFRYDTRAISAIDAVRSLKVDFDSIASKYL